MNLHRAERNGQSVDRGIELSAEVAEALGLPSAETQHEKIAKAAKQKWSKGIEDTTGTVIDEPNIEKALTSGSGFAEGKMRIMYQFSHVTDLQALESWLKNIRFHVWYLQSLLQKESQKDLDVLMAISI